MRETGHSSKRFNTIASDAYIYAYPIVLNETIAEACASSRRNKFLELQDDELDRSIANEARLASFIAWIDVAREPVVVSFPATDRYHYISFTDGFSNALGSAGSRITGGDAFDVLIARPNSSITSAPATSGRIETATSLVRVVARTAFYTNKDLKDALQFQSDCRITPISGIGLESAENRNLPSIRIDYEQLISRVEGMNGEQFFSCFSALLAGQQVASSNEPIRSFASAQQFWNVEPAVRAARARIRSYRLSSMRIGNWWADFSAGPYGRDYLRRAAAVRSRFFNDISQDYIRLVTGVDSSGDPLDGRFRYRLAFHRCNEPRARGPWFVGTEPSLRLSGSKMAWDTHGNIRIFMQRSQPADVPQSHWLPTSAGPFEVVLHIFWPGDAILDGRWIPPSVELAT